MKTLKKISNLDLSELLVLCSRMNDEIERFKHVSDHLPNSVKKSITGFYLKCYEEETRREQEY